MLKPAFMQEGCMTRGPVACRTLGGTEGRRSYWDPRDPKLGTDSTRVSEANMQAQPSGSVWQLWPGGPGAEWAALSTPETTKPLPSVMFNLSLQNTGREQNLTFKMVVLNKLNMFNTPASRKRSGCPHMAPQQDLLCPRAPGGHSAAQNTETEGSGK